MMQELLIECGADFEKCFRQHKPLASYNNSAGNILLERHDDFWKDRKFRVLLWSSDGEDEGIWLSGRVVRWYEYTTNPYDRFTKWTLEADIEPAAAVDDDDAGTGNDALPPVGSLVNGDSSAKRLILVTENNREQLKDAELFGGRISFDVNRMNVLGGGTVSFSSNRSSCYHNANVSGIPASREGALLSLEWEEPPPGEGDYCFLPPPPPPTASEYNTPNPPAVVDKDELKARREESIAILDSGDWEKFIEAAEDKLNDPHALRMQLLCTPFPLLPRVLTYLLEALGLSSAATSQSSEDCQLVQMIAETVVEMKNDKDWQQMVEARPELTSCYRTDKLVGVPPEDRMEFVMLACLFDSLDRVGKFYDRMNECRASLYWYEFILETAEKTPITQPDELISARLCDAGRANRMADNMVAASRYYERALLLHHNKGDANIKTLIDNSKWVKEEIREWIGTSGRITPWKSGDEKYIPEKTCPVCNKEATNQCSACKLVCFCCAECQRKHWKLAHKYTCLSSRKR